VRGRIEARHESLIHVWAGVVAAAAAAAGITRLRKVMLVYRTGEPVGNGSGGKRKRERETHALGMQALNNRQ